LSLKKARPVIKTVERKVPEGPCARPWGAAPLGPQITETVQPFVPWSFWAIAKAF
jgi:hypothetical protein